MSKNRQRRSSFFSCFNIFKDKRYQGGDSSSNRGKSEKVFPSDRDNRFGVVGDPHVDSRAGKIIARKKEVWQSQSQDPSNSKKNSMEIGTTACAAPGADCEGYQK